MALKWKHNTILCIHNKTNGNFIVPHDNTLLLTKMLYNSANEYLNLK